MVERFFADLTEEHRRPGSVTSIVQLTRKIKTYLAERNENQKQYRLTAKGEEILYKTHWARQALLRQEEHEPA